MLRFIVVFFIVLYGFPSIVLAHPGRTAADGCHYCRTNCEKWGVVEGERHCHTQVTSDSGPSLSRIRVPSPVQPKASPASKLQATNQPSQAIASTSACSAQTNNVCAQSCTAGNDFDCCNSKSGYVWYHDWGCYPQEIGRCSATQDRKCSSACTAGNDYDCCLRMDGYTWYENWGCYPKK